MTAIPNRHRTKTILTLAAPVILEMILGMVVWIADTAMVGRLDAKALSAVGLGGQIFFSSVNVFASIGVGAAAIVARHIGAKNYERSSESATHAFQLGILLGIILFVCSYFFFDKFFVVANAEEDVVILGSDYLRILSVAGIFMVPGFISSAILRATGDTKTPMIGAIITNLINLVGDYVLIFGKWGFPRLEVAGAAIATAIGQIIGFTYVMLVLFKGRGPLECRLGKGTIKNSKDFKQIWKFSFPALINELMISGGRLIYSFMVIGMGTLSFAANQIAVTAESLSFMPNSGFAVAATTLVGQSLGAGDEREAEEYGWSSAFLAAVVMGVTALIFLFFPTVMARLFTDEGDVVELAGKCIRIASLEQIPMAYSMVLSGALKGAGDTKGAMYITIGSNWLYRLPVSFLAIYILKLPVAYLWFVTAIQYIIETAFFAYRFKKREWVNIRIS